MSLAALFAKAYPACSVVLLKSTYATITYDLRLERKAVALFHLIVDAGLVTLAAWRSELPYTSAIPFGLNWFTPILLVGGARLVRLALPRFPRSAWLEDRLVFGLLLAIVSVALPFDATIGLAVLALLGTCLLLLQLGRSPATERSPNSQLTSRP